MRRAFQLEPRRKNRIMTTALTIIAVTHSIPHHAAKGGHVPTKFMP